MTETAYHNERFGRGEEITPDRFRARVEARGGAAFFIGVELPCEPAQLVHFNQFLPVREGNRPAQPADGPAGFISCHAHADFAGVNLDHSIAALGASNEDLAAPDR